MIDCKMKKRNNKGKATFNFTIVTIVILLGIYGLVHRNISLQKSIETTCKIVDIGHSPGRGVRPEKVFFEYSVNGIVQKGEAFLPSNYDVKIGEHYWLKYSSDDPKVTDILFDRGKIECE